MPAIDHLQSCGNTARRTASGHGDLDWAAGRILPAPGAGMVKRETLWLLAGPVVLLVAAALAGFPTGHVTFADRQATRGPQPAMATCCTHSVSAESGHIPGAPLSVANAGR